MARRPRPRPRPRNSGGNERQARNLLRRASRLLRREKLGPAQRLIQRGLRLKPRSVAPFYSLLGQVLYEREKPSQAFRYLIKAYRISPRQTGAGLVTLGSIYYERKKRKQAKRVYRQYLKYFPRGKHVDDVKAMLKN